MLVGFEQSCDAVRRQWPDSKEALMRKAFALSLALILVFFLTGPATYAKSLVLNNAPSQCLFNFTRAAEEKKAENLLIIKSKELAGIYIDNWKKHLEHSEVCKARD